MNTALILQPLLDILKWLLPPMLVLALLKSRLFKGWFGEQLIRLFTHFLLNRHVYRRLHDVTLTTPDGTTQIGVQRGAVTAMLQTLQAAQPSAQVPSGCP